MMNEVEHDRCSWTTWVSVYGEVVCWAILYVVLPLWFMIATGTQTLPGIHRWCYFSFLPWHRWHKMRKYWAWNTGAECVCDWKGMWRTTLIVLFDSMIDLFFCVVDHRVVRICLEKTVQYNLDKLFHSCIHVFFIFFGGFPHIIMCLYWWAILKLQHLHKLNMRWNQIYLGSLTLDFPLPREALLFIFSLITVHPKSCTDVTEAICLVCFKDVELAATVSSFVPPVT